MSANDHIAAWKAYLSTLTGVAVYSPDDLALAAKSVMPDRYLQIDVGYRLRGAYRNSNRPTSLRQGWFLSVWTVASSRNNVAALRGLMAPLETKRLNIAGTVTSPVTQAFADDLPELSDGLWSSRSEWNYVHP